MATNEVFHDGDSLYLPVLAAAASGGAVIVGMICGVCETARDAAGFATVRTKGVFNLSVTGAVASVGLPIYITSATYALTPTVGAGAQVFGHAMDTKAGGAGIIRVRIAQYAVAVGTPA